MNEFDAANGVFVRTESTLWRRCFDGVVVLGPASDRPIAISGPGARIWSLLDVPASASSISEALASEFDVAAAAVLPDVVGVLLALDETGAIAMSVD